MNTAITTIIAAGLAVLGTLLSPILVQYANARTKAQEFELARRQRQEEREAERLTRDFTELRSTYTTLNTEMRGYHRALSNYLHLICSGDCNEDARAVLNDARHKYLQCYADAQMIVSDNVLSAAASPHAGLAQLYGVALRLDGSTRTDPSPETKLANNEAERLETAFADWEVIRLRIHNLRDTMREELGVSSAGE